ncbi:6-phosphofructokinase [Arsenicicoccus dermatophilus]|uniref:6-phosphofructokinase n=1 Tax=Arsenicicoccus dermatophilus TaxID=1076331 RepID=UPI001F4CC95D|nr:6-phosphofructokinase [Arsenicicoccus dermatophilus]MCH8614327.1 6-phosphofructokinase [Arsenicicoccus dermatophilus]
MEQVPHIVTEPIDAPPQPGAETVSAQEVLGTPVDGTGKRIGILTSGGDAQGMNAAVRAAVRTALHLGAEVFAIYEGYQGMVDGGDGIRQVGWDDVGNVLHRGGTMIGTFRSKDFREREGRMAAARHLLERGIDRLVVIGGDGSLSGLDLFRAEWPELLADLVAAGRVTRETADAHPALMIAGLVGSIDNDLVGTDMTIGADSALHRIVDAIDAIASTAASHQRSFVVEVMGRHCGYLTLMSAIAGGCDYALIPEHPPADGWEDRMCAELRRGRQAGRRDSIVVVAEGAQDRSGAPITAAYVRETLEQRLGEDTRVTILGHVQRGGRPSAFDRWASTWLGHAAAHEVLSATADTEGHVIGIRGNRIARVPLVQAVERTREVPAAIERGDYDRAMTLRGGSFTEMTQIFTEMSEPPTPHVDGEPRRIGILHAGGLAPGMNTAARAAVRLGIDRGHTMLGIRGGFPGLRDGKVSELSWADVEGWTALGGAELGIRRSVPEIEHLYSIGRSLEEHRLDALLVIGGWNAYQGTHLLWQERDRYPAFRIPIVCVPASIDNNLPASELAIGADTALNVVVDSIDRIKQSASARRRCFVVETMGRYCGYLALMGGLAGGAERVYLHEEGITLDDLQRDVARLRASFDHGRRLFLAVRNERASEQYTMDFLARLFDQEGGERYDVRQAVLGHVQQGGDPSPFDRVLATRLVAHAVDLLTEELTAGGDAAQLVGLVRGRVRSTPVARMHDLMDLVHRRPRDQWWLDLRPVVTAVSEPADQSSSLI